ncbi:MAG: helix-turn-helix transcriptional regulator [Duncaniella sp.]|nr:helix-turn-helix transcriptional regulator [Duncaniella sp.]
MDLVSRLKKYLDLQNISVTQFADECGIPRPSASQLLAGRNKKVSDEIIGKIHAVYPNLSIIWLMFGEGEMLLHKDAETTDADFEYATGNLSNFEIENKSSGADAKLNPEFAFENPSDSKNETAKTEENNLFSGYHTFDFSNSYSKKQTNKQDSLNESGRTSSSLNSAVAGKQVVGIVVYYNDKTFESFVPDPDNMSPFAKK